MAARQRFRRTALTAALLALPLLGLGGCETMRDIAGAVNVFGGGGDDAAQAAASSRVLPPNGIPASDIDRVRGRVPDGLSGDVANAAYSADPITPR